MFVFQIPLKYRHKLLYFVQNGLIKFGHLYNLQLKYYCLIVGFLIRASTLSTQKKTFASLDRLFEWETKYLSLTTGNINSFDEKRIITSAKLVFLPTLEKY